LEKKAWKVFRDVPRWLNSSGAKYFPRYNSQSLSDTGLEPCVCCRHSAPSVQRAETLRTGGGSGNLARHRHISPYQPVEFHGTPKTSSITSHSSWYFASFFQLSLFLDVFFLFGSLSFFFYSMTHLTLDTPCLTVIGKTGTLDDNNCPF